MNKDIMNKIIAFRDARDWKKFHTGENLAKALNIEAAELLELYQWKHEIEDLDNLKDELADVLIYCFLIADCYNLDIEEIILNKIKKNEMKYPVSKAYGNSKKYTDL